jgi:hypothetical protein
VNKLATNATAARVEQADLQAKLQESPLFWVAFGFWLFPLLGLLLFVSTRDFKRGVSVCLEDLLLCPNKFVICRKVFLRRGSGNYIVFRGGENIGWAFWACHLLNPSTV